MPPTMTVGGVIALAGLFLAGRAYLGHDVQAFAWALALFASAPLPRLIVGSVPKPRPAVSATANPPTGVGTPSHSEAEAKIAEYNAAKLEQYQKHVKR